MLRALTIAPLVLFLWLVAGLSPVSAAPLTVEEVPAPLQPWVDWVLHDLPQARCPYLQGSSTSRRCQWPSNLSFVIGNASGSFEQRWQVHERGWVPLPGDAERWPQGVTVDGEEAVVIARGGRPGVELIEGIHELRGEILWDSMPERLQVPPETGLLELRITDAEGVEKVLTAPQREADGIVWLHRRAEEGAETNRMELVVNRRVIDTLPIVVTTQVELQVSGKNREVVLGDALLTGFVPMGVSSELPVRLEPDGSLRAQVRPGRWTISVDARYGLPITALPLEATEGPWAEEEIWVFEAHNELRRVELSGVDAVDPQQTRLPEEWKSLPAYRVRPGDTMLMAETHRGEIDRGPDRLRLDREWWLDFDGGGLTVRDRISGELYGGSRLTMGAPATLGRVSAGGKDQFITHLGDEQRPGVEIRQRALNVQAESRVPMSKSLSAVDWEHDFHEVSGTLNLPPGWRLLHAAGVDEVDDSWIKRWDLLQIFLVLVITIGIARLYGVFWGFFALLTLTLSFPEWMAPRAIWLFVLAGEGLLRVLPEGRLRKVMGFYRLVTLVVLAGIVVTFSVQQLRGGLYPALEKTSGDDLGSMLFGGGRYEEKSYATDTMAPPQAEYAPEPMMDEDYRDDAKFDDMIAEEQIAGDFAQDIDGILDGGEREFQGGKGQRHKGEEGQMGRPVSQIAKQGSFGKLASKKQLQEYDASTVIQTGPGVPSWNWRRLSLGWSGPVDREQRVQLFLLNPQANLSLAAVRVAFMALLSLVVLGVFGRRRRERGPAELEKGKGPGKGAGAAASLALAIGLGTLFAPQRAAADEVPRDEVLDQLRARLIETPACLPECAVIPRVELTADGEVLRLVIEIHTASAIATPLPGNATQWLPTSILVDEQEPGEPGRGLARTADGNLWIDLPAGRHRLVLEGPLPARETVQIAFPLPPHRVEASATGWTIEGIHEDGIADPDLQLTRIHSEDKASDTLEMGPLPAFVRVERELDLGLTWEVRTRVVRLSPPGSAVVLAVPLLPGESVTTADLRVEDEKVQVNMAPEVLVAEWSSALEVQPTVALTAAEGQPWVELWRLQVGPVWHVEHEGIPVIRQGDGGLREWQPWPGEAISLVVSRPEGVAGQTKTIDNARLDLRPGLRATDATLTVSIRSSRGGQHDFVLPPEAQLQSVLINGSEQQLGQSGSQVRVPVVPGFQTVALNWREPMVLQRRYDAPAVGLGAAAVNVSVHVDFPRDRWILWVNGPKLGPAVLFWSYIVMLVIAALVLSRVRGTPLRVHQWFLLGLGLSPLPVPAAMLVIGWILALAWRRRQPKMSSGWFNLRQLILVGWTIAALGALIGAITAGLLGQPDMQIQGNGSYASSLEWFQDRSEGGVPRPWIIAVSMWWYRGAMLAWALWLAWSLMRWLPWAWQSFSGGGYWLRMFPESRDKSAKPESAAGSSARMPSPSAASQSKAWRVPARPDGEAPGWAGTPTPELGSRPLGPSRPARQATSMGHSGSTPSEPPARSFSPPLLRRPGRSPSPPAGTVIPERLSTKANPDE